MTEKEQYHRYHIPTSAAPEIEKWPSRFNVTVGRVGLAKNIIKEIFHYGLGERREVVLSRPCIYGVFSGPVGGFAPRPQECVGCLRCTTEYPDYVKVEPNPQRQKLGDSYFTFGQVNTISVEALDGSIPVKGAGYRGKFGGEGWDGMWTDMSEIVRPTRDGIHGRESISTIADIGYAPAFLQFDADGNLQGDIPNSFSIPLPLLLDLSAPAFKNDTFIKGAADAAAKVGTLIILPVEVIKRLGLTGEHVVPLLKKGDEAKLGSLVDFRLVTLSEWDAQLYAAIRQTLPEALASLQIDSVSDALTEYVRAGIHVFQWVANFHGNDPQGSFILDSIRKLHKFFVEVGIREEVTLLGSGGMIAAEHIPKALLVGLDVVALDTPLVVAVQGKFGGECANRKTSRFTFPKNLTVDWVAQRIENLAAAWRDQLLEISGAMGIRETRRLRGEMGRAMFMKHLEADAFEGIDGYEN